MKKIAACLISLLCIGATGQNPSHVSEHATPISCPADVRIQLHSAVDQMVQSKYPSIESEDIEISNLQGFFCEIKDGIKTFMAELVYVRVRLKGSHLWAHGTFHIHFSETGEWIPTSGSSPSRFLETANPSK